MTSILFLFWFTNKKRYTISREVICMIGERLAEIRKDHGDTQASLAKKLGVALPTVRSWEQEKSSPSHELLVTICRLYRISSDFLLGLTDYDPAYIGRRQTEQFSKDELAALRDFELFLHWKKHRY